MDFDQNSDGKHPILTLSILGANWLDLGNAIKIAEKVNADAIQVDIGDGHFIPTITLGERLIKHIREVSSIPIEVHLMVSRPQDYFKRLAEFGANSVLIHAEASPVLYDLILDARSYDLNVGVALNIATSVSTIEPILRYVDMVTLMAIVLGYAGKPFFPETIDKLVKLRKMIDQDSDCTAIIQIDGGIKEHNIFTITEAGMDNVLISSAIYHAQDPVIAAATLRAGMCSLSELRQRNLSIYLNKLKKK